MTLACESLKKVNKYEVQIYPLLRATFRGNVEVSPQTSHSDRLGQSQEVYTFIHTNTLMHTCTCVHARTHTHKGTSTMALSTEKSNSFHFLNFLLAKIFKRYLS